MLRMRIGSLQLIPICSLALAGYTNLPFRSPCASWADWDLATTDLVNARSLLGKENQGAQLIETRPRTVLPGRAVVWRRRGKCAMPPRSGVIASLC